MSENSRPDAAYPVFDDSGNSTMTVRHCLVSGASGFIGRALCNFLLAQGCRVRALLRRKSDGPWHEAVLCNLGFDSLPAESMGGIDTVFHLAGVVHAMQGDEGERPPYDTVNVGGSEAIAAAAAAAGVRRFIYFSSVKAVGDPGRKCVDERWQTLPQDPYGLSKRAAEQRLLAIGGQTSMQVSVLRPALVYGAGAKGNLERMIEAIDRGRFPPLPETRNRRSMVHVDDLVQAAWLVATHARADGEIYIVSDGAAYSSRQIYEWMAGALGRKLPAWHVPAWMLTMAASAGDAVQRTTGLRLPINSEVVQRLTGSACYEAGKLRRDLCWEPRRRLHEALPDMVAAYCRSGPSGVS
jgi:UDP-glucose 4-epimerase